MQIQINICGHAIKNFQGRLQPKSAYCVKGNIVQEILDENIVNTES